MPSKQNFNKKVEDTLEQPIKFSFQFYDTSCNEYCLSVWGENMVSEALNKLKDLNNKTLKELYTGKKIYHFHPVDWSQTIKKSGFPDSRANALEPYQFSLIGVNSSKARVFGAFAQGIFYIVWFDLEHKIDPTFKKHT